MPEIRFRSLCLIEQTPQLKETWCQNHFFLTFPLTVCQRLDFEAFPITRTTTFQKRNDFRMKSSPFSKSLREDCPDLDLEVFPEQQRENLDLRRLWNHFTKLTGSLYVFLRGGKNQYFAILISLVFNCPNLARNCEQPENPKMETHSYFHYLGEF